MWFLYSRIDTGRFKRPRALKPRNRAMYVITNYDIACYQNKFRSFKKISFFAWTCGSLEYVCKEKSNRMERFHKVAFNNYTYNFMRYTIYNWRSNNSLSTIIFEVTVIFQSYEKVCPTVHNIGRASICAEITRSLEYCFHYIRNVIAIFKSEKILFQLYFTDVGHIWLYVECVFPFTVL